MGSTATTSSKTRTARSCSSSISTSATRETCAGGLGKLLIRCTRDAYGHSSPGCLIGSEDSRHTCEGGPLIVSSLLVDYQLTSLTGRVALRPRLERSLPPRRVERKLGKLARQNPKDAPECETESNISGNPS